MEVSPKQWGGQAGNGQDLKVPGVSPGVGARMVEDLVGVGDHGVSEWPNRVLVKRKAKKRNSMKILWRY